MLLDKAACIKKLELPMDRVRRTLYYIATGLAIIFSLIITVSILLHRPQPEVPVDPHEGQVYLYDGKDWIWMTPLDGVPVNTLTADQFASSGKVRYLGSEYSVLKGIDVSEHQWEIDWKAVADAGVDFSCIRIGRRGYTEGGLFEDPWFEKNIQGSLQNGLKTGVYFFSQALNTAEAIEEANFVLERIADYDIDAPVVYDWETVEDEGSRSLELSKSARTECAVAFCEVIRQAGYTPCIYFNRDIGYYGYDLTKLTNYMFWFSLPESMFPNFYYACSMWQYSFTESVPGVSGNADMNLWFIPRSDGTAVPDEPQSSGLPSV